MQQHEYKRQPSQTHAQRKTKAYPQEAVRTIPRKPPIDSVGSRPPTNNTKKLDAHNKANQGKNKIDPVSTIIIVLLIKDEKTREPRCSALRFSSLASDRSCTTRMEERFVFEDTACRANAGVANVASASSGRGHLSQKSMRPRVTII